MRLRSLVLNGRSLDAPIISAFKPDGAEVTPRYKAGIGSRKLEFRFKAQINFTDYKD